MREWLGVLMTLGGLGIAGGTTDLWASAYQAPRPGSRAQGTGGAFVASADDPSAIYWNPAGIARLQGNHVYVGGGGLVRRLEFTGVTPYPGYGVREKAPNDFHATPHAFATFHLSDYVVGGVGFYVPYSWNSGWQRASEFTGRYIMAAADVDGFTVNPTIGMEVTPGLSAGVGVDLVFADATFVRYEPTILYIGPRAAVVDLAKMTLASDLTVGLTFNAGLLLDWSSFHIGLSYRHGLTNGLEGDARFDFVGIGNEELDEGLRERVPRNQRASVDVPFPAAVTLGLAWDIAERWQAAVDVGFTRWSVFDVLAFRFDDAALSRSYVRDYDDVVDVRAGLSLPAGERLTFRVGGLYEPTPAPTRAIGPILPDADRFGITAGFGYAHERWRLDLHEQLLFFSDNTVRDSAENFNGDYEAMAWIFGVSVGHDF
jgi:long-chain fatty acid transport protein